MTEQPRGRIPVWVILLTGGIVVASLVIVWTIVASALAGG